MIKKVATIVAMSVFSILFMTVFGILLNPSLESEPFYVGVTYCGESVEDAYQLIDKVKDYTNLFVIQSGSLQGQPEKLNQIIDYAIDSDLFFIVYFGNKDSNLCNNWFETFDHRWDNHFLGVYFGDEPGGKMLDSTVGFRDDPPTQIITKLEDGTITLIYFDPSSEISSRVYLTYKPDGTISVRTKKMEANGTYIPIFATYFSNGTIMVETSDSNDTRIQLNDYVPFTFEELWDISPFTDYNETSDRFIETVNFDLKSSLEGSSQVQMFTSDYALYWYDYLSGYDVLLAQVGWNHTLTQDIALVRGAANMMNKNWGTIITWKYNQPPYLDSGEAIYDQMKTAYESGAKYAVVFNYAKNMNAPYGTLQEEHFGALENFWNEVVQNPEIKQGSVKANAVLVLPENYGWGMRFSEDKIWGLWKADEKAEQIWNLRTYLLEEYGLNIDIVYGDPDFSVDGIYDNIYYWNQTI